MQSPPPGWYPDPQDAGRTRWWDGVGWTDQTAADNLGMDAWAGAPSSTGQPYGSGYGQMPAGGTGVPPSRLSRFGETPGARAFAIASLVVYVGLLITANVTGLWWLVLPGLVLAFVSRLGRRRSRPGFLVAWFVIALVILLTAHGHHS